MVSITCPNVLEITAIKRLRATTLMTTNAKIEVDDKFVLLDYSLGHFKMLTEKQNKMLKAVKHDFYNPTNKNDEDALF